jgi:hypothetical protein
MAILNDISSNKYMLVEPIVYARNGKYKTLKKRIVHINFDNPCNVLDYFKSFLEVITFLCLEGDMYSARVNPNGFELRGYVPWRYQNSEKFNPAIITVKVCPKTKAIDNSLIEFVFDEDMFDDYLDSKPIVNPQYVYKQEHWIVQIFKGTWDATPAKVEAVIAEPEVLQVTIPDNIEVLSVVALSQKLFKNFMPCDINVIALSKSKEVALDIQVVQYSDDGTPLYSYLPVTNEMITIPEYAFLNELRVFKELNPSNTLSVHNDGFSQVEFIQTVDYEVPVDEEVCQLIAELDELIAEQRQQAIDSIPTPTDVTNLEVVKRNDMAAKFFAVYQPCVVTGLEFSTIPGNLYSLNLIKRSRDGHNYPMSILIPTNSVREKDRNFFTEFENNLRKDRFVRIDKNCISFVDDNSLAFVEDYVEPYVEPNIEPIAVQPVLDDVCSDQDDLDDDKIWFQLDLMLIPIDNTDDEDIMFEPLPEPKKQLSKKEVVKNFFYQTFNNTPEFQTLTFALQQEGHVVVLHQDDMIYPCGKKILYGCKLLDFDPRIRDVIQMCINKGIHFYNINQTLFGKVFDEDGGIVETREFMSLLPHTK